MLSISCLFIITTNSYVKKLELFLQSCRSEQTKEQTSYDDLLDALRLALKGYNIE